MSRPILVIEDDATLRQLLQDWVEALFPAEKVIGVPDGRGALSLVTQTEPVAILIGSDTLRTAGVSVIRRVKRAAPGARIAALALDDHDALRGDVAAAGGACVRAWDIDDGLLPLLRRWIEAQRDEGSVKATVSGSPIEDQG